MIPSAKFQQLLQEAVAHHQGGRLARAEAIYRQLLVTAPRSAQITDLLGQLATQQGRTAEALRLFHQAWQLDERAAPVAVRLASALISAERTPDAEKVLRRVTQKNPQSADAWNALAYTLKVQGRLTEAVECHERAVKLNPNFLEGWYHYGLTLASLGKNFQGLHCHERALAINPRYARARFGRAQALHKVYRLEEAIADYDAFLKAEPNHHEARSYRLFALQNLDCISREQLFAEHCAYGRAVGAGPATLPGYDLSPDRRLRVAILSPDLRTHSCAYFLEPLLRQLDPGQFELYLYHDHFSEDDVSARLRGLAAVWRNFVGQPHAAVERAIRADQPDLLIDLTGHIGMTVRLPLFARRLAPVQITYLGYPDTTGVAAMDYRFTDAIADPPGEGDRLHTEKLVRFAPTAWCYQPPADAPEIAPPPCATGADVTFGCFSSPTKFTDTLFGAWARILASAPGSRLLLKGRDFNEDAVREHMLARLARAGVPMDRLELLPRTAGTAEHLALYNHVDVALDTFPYAGTTTTCEALWMGRPVVTLRGDRHAGRVGASLLTAAGHPEWIATNVDDYVRIAAGLASEPAKLAVTAASLREQMRGSALMDEAGQGRRFAAALRRCWQERVAAMPATAIVDVV
ncbi:MAG TPA: tetratricopeptide repeat protein [Opitutaceae bacterium]